ncbi:MAG: chorismate-binding protein [Bacteroidetes bacterium]|nr:MAG: chorismate-binding protein [Bacteroidota bacterium]PTM14290.1 MAG: chorismate-binding protein [Bacteroidota bacterium]
MSENAVQLLETICLLNGKMDLLPLHQERVNHARRKLFGIKKQLNLRTYLAQQVLPATGYHKIRIVYDQGIQSFSCTPYSPRKVSTLRIVELEPFNYRFKYANRSELDKAFTYRDGCDDILMSWNSYLTDTYYGNIALHDGHKWWTPAHPLLKGVRRASLCRQEQLHPTLIRVPDLKYFKELRIINAMIPLADSVPISMDQIFLPGAALV